MPTYEYECKSCNNFEVFQAMTDEPLKTCPTCGKEVRRLIFGGAGVIFKGSGFYVTDKNKAGSVTSAPAASCAGDAANPACSSCPANSAAADKSPKAEQAASGGGGSQKSPEASAPKTA